MAALSAVAIVSTEIKGKRDRNNWDTARGNLKTSSSSLYRYKSVVCYFSLPKKYSCFFDSLLFGSSIYRQQA
jgi:hypothetical protein